MDDRALADALLAWFYQNRRTLPFRQNPTPYHIWLSEIMAQQTRMTALIPYYERFVAACPDIPSLAACEPEHLHKLWEGLGYYSRVRNLQKAAKIVCEQYGGQLPGDYMALHALPGIGDYTAGAIASIGFGIAVPAVDGNVLRVLSRLDADTACVSEPETKKKLTRRAAALLPAQAPGDFNQALMELGALVCVPNGAPLCDACPWHDACKARAKGIAEKLPVKARPKARRILDVAVALVHSPAGWLIHRRSEKGLLAGLWEPVIFEDTVFATREEMAAALADKGIFVKSADEKFSTNPDAIVEKLPAAKHVFTHLEWHMNGWQFEAQAGPLGPDYAWATPEQLKLDYTMPGAFRVYRTLMLQGDKKGNAISGETRL